MANLQMDNKQIIDIQKFWNVTEYICKDCGVIIPVDEIVPHFAPHIQAYQLFCPDCGHYIKQLRSAKVIRIFKNIGEGMVEVEKIDREWLKWAVSVDHSAIRNPTVLEAVRRRINSKDEVIIKDIKMDKDEIKKLDRINKVKEEIAELELSIPDWIEKRRVLTLECVGHDYVTFIADEVKLKWYSSAIKKAGRRIVRLKDEIGLLEEDIKKA